MNTRERIEYHQGAADTAEAAEIVARNMSEKFWNAANVDFRDGNFDGFCMMREKSDAQDIIAERHARSARAHRALERAARIAVAAERVQELNNS